MRLNFFLFLALFFSGCATQSQKTRARFATFPQYKLIDVPFIAQEQYYCAPATLAMISNFLKKNNSPEELAQELSKMLYTPEMKGSFQNDVLAATRRLGFIAVPVNSLEDIFTTLNHNNPVLIFQNLGLSWIPRWHYALVVGYDLEKQEIILHTGEYKNFRMKIFTFEKIWNRVENWGLNIVNAGTIPVTTNEFEMIKATAGLELAQQILPAQISYLTILEKWHDSLGANIGLGNIYYQTNDFKNAEKYFKQATQYHPSSFIAWHNYTQVLIETNQLKKARLAAAKALENAEPSLRDNYQKKFEESLGSRQ